MNRGAVETAKAITRRGLSINAAAELVGADGGTFSKILREVDKRKPGRALASRILSEFGISPSLWDEPTDEPAPNPEEAAQNQKTAGTES